MRHLSGVPLKGRLLALSANVDQPRKACEGKHSSLFGLDVNKKCCITLTPGANVVKLFMVVSYELS